MFLHLQDGKGDNCMVCQDIAMLGPVMIKQYSKLKVSESTRQKKNIMTAIYLPDNSS